MSADDLVTVHYYADGTATVECSCGFASKPIHRDSVIGLVNISHQRACRKRPRS